MLPKSIHRGGGHRDPMLAWSLSGAGHTNAQVARTATVSRSGAAMLRGRRIASTPGAVAAPPRADEGHGHPPLIGHGVRLWTYFKRLTGLGFPRRFPVVQFPNAPLIVAFAAGQAGHLAHGVDHTYTSATGYLAMTIWAYEEAVRGVNWFRHALGMVYLVLMVVRVASALHT